MNDSNCCVMNEKVDDKIYWWWMIQIVDDWWWMIQIVDDEWLRLSARFIENEWIWLLKMNDENYP